MANKQVVIEFVGKDGVTRTARVVAGSLDDVADSGERVSKSTRGAGEATKQAGDKAAGAAGQFQALEGALSKVASAAIVMEIAQKAYDFVDAGKSIGQVRTSFQNLAESANIDSQKLLGSLRSASQGYVDDVTLMTGANKALLTGNQELAQKLPQLLQIAGAAAKATGGDINQLYSDLIEGVVKAEPEILDNLGLTINLTQVYDQYANTLGKSAQQLTQAEKSQALLNAVIQQGEGYIDRLGNSTIFAGSSLDRLTTKYENLKASFQENAAIALEDALRGGSLVEDYATEVALQNSRAYEQYIAVLQRVDETESALSKTQYMTAQAMIAKGAAVDQAIGSVSTLDALERELTAAMEMNASAAQLSATAQQDLIVKAEGVAVRSQSANNAVVELTDRFYDGEISAEEFAAALDKLANAADQNEQGAVGLTGAAVGLLDVIQQLVPATDDQTSATESLISAMDADIQATFEAQYQKQQLAFALDQSRDAASIAIDEYFAAGGALNAMAMDALKARNEIAALYVTMAQGQLTAQYGSSMPTEVANYYAKGRAQQLLDPDGWKQEYQQITQRMNRDAAARVREAKPSRSGGGRGSKSDATKAAEKEQKELEKVHDKIEKEETRFRKDLEKINEQYFDNVTAAWRKYYADLAAETAKLQSDQFDSRADFLTALADMDAQDRAAASAAYEQYWAETNALAQAGEVEKANTLRAAAQEEILANVEREQAIRELQQQAREEQNADLRADLEARIALLQEADRLADDQAQSRLDKIRQGDDQIAKERDQSLEDAQNEYRDASQQLADDFRERNDEISAAYGDLQAAHAAAMAAMIAASQQAAAELAALSGQVGGAGEVKALDGSHARGLDYVPHDGYIAELHQGEMIVPAAPAQRMRQSGIGSLNSYIAPPPSPSSGTTINQTTNQITATIGGTQRNVRFTPQEEAQINRIVQAAMKRGAAHSLDLNSIGAR